MEEQDDQFIVEFTRIGAQVKVTALDPQSLVEVSIVGSSRAARAQLAQLAVRKLKYMLAKDPPGE